MKKCTKCNQFKSLGSFAIREDSWARYAWCGDCQVQEGRHKESPDVTERIEKTRLFFEKPKCQIAAIQNLL